MRIYDIIAKKRDKKTLTKEEIEFFITEYCNGEIPDYQASALLMACFLNGLNDEETISLTLAMRDSGKTLDLSEVEGFTVDKHSTGGVGDKTTLIIAPIVAACGGKVAQMAGRGLGHTGGTLDKFEAIEGYNCYLSDKDFIKQINLTGCSVIGQTAELVPADKKLYALRDVTATVESIPLIVASIMSKKLATNADGIVFDVKYGSGAFMKTKERAEELAEKLIEVGRGAGKKICALITSMNQPLGRCIGNALEVAESIDILQGRGDADLRELCLALSANMLLLSGKGDFALCRRLAEEAVADGRAFSAFLSMVKAQGGNENQVKNPFLLPQAAYSYDVLSPKSGYIFATEAEKIGISALMLGAGRLTKTDVIDLSAGIIIKKKVGDEVRKGEPIATLYASDSTLFALSAEKLLSAVSVREEPPEKENLIYKIIY